MSGLLTSEMSAYKAGYGNMLSIKREVDYASILPKTRTGAGNEDTGSNLTSNKRADTLDGGSRDTGYISEANETMEGEV